MPSYRQAGSSDDKLSALDEIFNDNTVAITRYTESDGVTITDLDNVVINQPGAKQAIKALFLELIDEAIDDSETLVGFVKKLQQKVEEL